MKRKDCFFGLHFDFHANPDTRDIGVNFDPAVVEKIVTEVRPDFIQCDTKGHPGVTSFPSKMENRSGHIRKDILRGWREVTKKHGVLLFAHYSGLWDRHFTASHPEEASIDEDGKVSEIASVFGNYEDLVLVPQLVELAKDYGLDGAWVDGECWAMRPDFSEMAKKAFFEKYGFEMTKSDKNSLQLNRDAFYSYLKRYIEKVKREAPEFEITSNWTCSQLAPDLIDCTDYVSGDLSSVRGLSNARTSGRVMQSFGRNWDIMSWGISFPVHHVRSAEQLSQEASVILSLGGGFQVYNMQSPQDVVMDEWAIGEWAKVAKFCRERQSICQYSRPIEDVGVLFSAKAHYATVDWVFPSSSPYTVEQNGVLLSVSDLGHSASVILAERRDVDYRKYQTIVVPDALELEDGTVERLLDYAKNGGRLILCGENTAKLFADAVGYRVTERKNATPIATIFEKDFLLETRHGYSLIEWEGAKCVVPMSECIVDGDLNIPNPPPTICKGTEIHPAFAVSDFGRGRIGVLPMTLGKMYYNENTWELCELLRDCFDAVGKSLVSVNNSGLINVQLSVNGEKKYLHLTNIGGENEKTTTMTSKRIPPVDDTAVALDLGSEIAELKDALTGEPIAFEKKGTKVTFTVPKIGIDKIIAIG